MAVVHQNRVSRARDTLKPCPAAFLQVRAVMREVQRNEPLRQVLPYFSTCEFAIESDTHSNRTRPRRLIPMEEPQSNSHEEGRFGARQVWTPTSQRRKVESPPQKMLRDGMAN
jgi:hypothetical protein